MLVMNDLQSPVRETAREEIGGLFAILSVLLTLIAGMLILSVLGSTEFARDLTQGTHTADYSRVHTANWMAGAAAISAAIAAFVGIAKARTTGTVVVMLTGLYLLTLLPG